MGRDKQHKFCNFFLHAAELSGLKSLHTSSVAHEGGVYPWFFNM